MIILSFVSTFLCASPVSESRARDFAMEFFGGLQTRSSSADVRLVWSGNVFGGEKTDGEALMYIYNSVGSDGFVIISGESGVRPVIACSRETSFNLKNMSPATRALLEAWCRQIESVRNCKTTSESVASEEENVFGNIVQKYDTPLWGQGEPFNLEAPVYDGMRCVSGCVATAMSILAYCNSWPIAGSGTTPEYEYDGKYVPENVLGREYAYDDMLMSYSEGYTEQQGNAVAALMKDMGTAVQMMYGVGESGAFDSSVPYALVTYMGYSKNTRLSNAYSYDYSEWMSMLKANIDECGPMYYSGRSQIGGHAFIIDGYTDADYFSINYGWDGINNGYYLLPDIEFYSGQMALFDAVPDRNGTSQFVDYLMLIQANDYRGLQTLTDKYETGVPFECVISGIYNMGLQPFEGQIKISLCDSKGNIKEDLATKPYMCRLNSDVVDNIPIPVVINNEICLGDRLRLFYKGKYSEDWQYLRGYDNVTVSEIILASTSEQIVDGMLLYWSKDSKIMTVEANVAIQCEVDGNGRKTGASAWPYSPAVFSLADFPPGEYVLRVTSGDDPYELVIVL